MSPRTTSARSEKARLRREAEERARRRRRNGLVVGTVVAVLAVVVDGGVVTGESSAPVTVTVYADYLCPFCARFEGEVSPWLDEQREAGEVAVDYRPISILDNASSTRYSTRAANAAACVADTSPDSFADVNVALFAAQPPEGGPGLPDEDLVRIAEDAGATDVEACVADRTFTDWVATVTDQASRDGVTSTPTVLVDGEPVEASLEAVQAAVEAAA